MVMDGYYTQDHLQEIWEKISSLHYGYLNAEESTYKIEQRNKLEVCINEYLCLAPHTQKFFCHETSDILHRSAGSKNDFSGYRAALGWNAIGMYAANLLTQPWRQEFREIKMYSGFYKHQIEANLVGALEMFEVMGYKHVGDGILILEGPICPDRVTNVSQDSLVAYVECQILIKIWEEVSTTFNVTWLEVLKFREAHLCSPKQSVNAIIYNYHHRQFQQETNNIPQRSSASNSNYTHHAKDTTYHHQNNSARCSDHNIPNHYSTHTNSHINMQPAPQQSCMYANNMYPNYAATYAHVPHNYQYIPVNYPHIQQQYGIYCNGHTPLAQKPAYMCPVPTAQLIELDHTYDIPNDTRYAQTQRLELVHNGNTDILPDDDEVDQVIYAPKKRDYPSYSDTLSNKPHKTDKTTEWRETKSSDKEEGSGTFESWDYVYRNLESQGYTKDLGERGDLLVLKPDLKAPIKDARKLSVDLQKLSIDRPLKMNEALDKYKSVDANRERKNSDPQMSLYDNLSVDVSKNAKTNGKLNKSKTLMREKPSEVDYKYSSRTLDSRAAKKADVSEPINNKWECKACTFLNDNANDICEVCFKSKQKVSQDMAVGGSQCAKCTYVNAKDKKVCEVCGASLKNSPTYI